jgi:hypothetical protein
MDLTLGQLLSKILLLIVELSFWFINGATKLVEFRFLDLTIAQTIFTLLIIYITYKVVNDENVLRIQALEAVNHDDDEQKKWCKDRAKIHRKNMIGSILFPIFAILFCYLYLEELLRYIFEKLGLN